MRIRNYRWKQVIGIVLLVLLCVFNAESQKHQNDAVFDDANYSELRMKILKDSLKRIQQREFNPYRLSRFWKKKEVSYMPHTLNILFRMPDYGSVSFKSSYNAYVALEKYQAFLSGQSMQIIIADQVPTGGILRKLIFREAIRSPQKVTYRWAELPEPRRNFNRTYLSSKQADESLYQLLRKKEELDTKQAMKKIKREKSPWTYEGIENVQLSQGHLSNWTKGGESSFSLLSDLRVKAIYSKDNHVWENSGIHKLGVLAQETSKTRINDDLLELNSKYGIKASDKWYYSAFANFKTQFFNGYSAGDKEKTTPISAFMTPAYWTFAIGMDYKTKKNNFTLMLSPLSNKVTMVMDTNKVAKRYGVPTGKKVHSINGASLVNSFKWNINEDFSVNSKFDAFYEYFADREKLKHYDADEVLIGEAIPLQMDWELILDMKINVWLSARVLSHLRYIGYESYKMQWKENFSLSFRYIIRYK
jgi:hypothetical protein